MDDPELLRRYAETRSEEAFAAFVRRHVDLVHSAALRETGGDAHRANEVTQMVFVDLSRKAGRLAGHPFLLGWLHRSTRYAAARLRRAEFRRQRYEQAAAAEPTLADPGAAVDWERLRPLLDEAVDALSPADREAVLLRFFARRPFAEIGRQLGLTENAARMRVERALGKLRSVLARRGVTSTALALAVVLSQNTAAAAPPEVVAAATAAGLAAAPAGFLSSFFGALSAKGVLAGAGAALIVGTVSLRLCGFAPAGRIEETNTTMRKDLAAGATLSALTQFAVLGSGWLLPSHPKAAERASPARREEMRLLMPRLEPEPPDPSEAEAEQRPLPLDAVPPMQPDAPQLSAPGIFTQAVEAPPLEKIDPSALRVAVGYRDWKAGIGLLNIDSLDQKPAATFQPQPVYPYRPRHDGIEGTATVKFVVDAAGNVIHATVVEPSRHEFDQAVLEAVHRWKFKPGRKFGRAVAFWAEQSFQFSLSADR